MSDTVPLVVRDRERAERYHEQLCRVAYLVGFYGSRAQHTGNADLHELVGQLAAAVDDGETHNGGGPARPSGRSR